MTKEETIAHFFSSFGIPAFEEWSVPTGELAPKYPYITYQLATDSWGYAVSISASIWHRGASWAESDAKVNEISESLGLGGTILPFDKGALWIQRGTPFAQSMGSEKDDLIKRKYMNFTVQYWTEN